MICCKSEKSAVLTKEGEEGVKGVFSRVRSTFPVCKNGFGLDCRF